MKVLILSDTHGYLDPRIAELAQHCDCAVHAGDIMDAAESSWRVEALRFEPAVARRRA